MTVDLVDLYKRMQVLGLTSLFLATPDDGIIADLVP